MQVDLVAAVPDDLPRLYVWMRQLRAADPMETEEFVPAGLAQAAMERLLNEPQTGRVWLIHVDGSAVGYIALTFTFSIEFGGRTAFIDELLIEESCRGRGVGRRVVEWVIDASKKLGVSNLVLEVSEENERARRLYRGCGFTDRKYRLMTRWLGDEE
ncbi:MAG TPA: GNAT family N-acetyltransferase [Tepidisphaeraceae bacterium]|jgi:ribosomal protein S18 acetylase RimI-like enzyme|nr:GNAT family N-acetyltransferase [Tepidisphaeraceae bacterium]